MLHLSSTLNIVNSIALRHAISVRHCNRLMKTVEEVRRARLAMLLLEFGSYVALNDLLGLNARDSTLSQIANQSENKKSGTKKQMGPDIARDLERVCKKERVLRPVASVAENN